MRAYLKSSLSLTLMAALLSSVPGVVAAPTAQATAAKVPVIVVFHEDAPTERFHGLYRAEERARRFPALWNYLDKGVAGAAQDLGRRHGFLADHVFSNVARGFSARLTERQIQQLASDPLVDYIEEDGVMSITVQSLPWGVNRIDGDISTTHSGDGTGVLSNVNAYVIDTGIYAHSDLKIAGHVNFTGDGKNTDCHGHGTHVAGTIAAKDNSTDVVGLMPGASLYGVKVFGCTGSGYTSNVIKGVDWVTANAAKPAIANMSLAGTASYTLDNAIGRSVDSGVFYAVAAGNNGLDACKYSPARYGPNKAGVLTVGAISSSDQEASWSNYGACVEAWAPGVSITSTRRGGGTTSMSGTSMASPHVGGTAGVYLSGHTGASPAAVETALKAALKLANTKSKDGRQILVDYAGSF
jgi:aqualysin 1